MRVRALRIGRIGALVALIATVCVSVPANLSQVAASAQEPQGGRVPINGTSDTITVDYSGHSTFNRVTSGRIASRHEDYTWNERITVAVPPCVIISKGCLSRPSDGSSVNFKVVGTPILTLSGTVSQRAPSWATAQVHAEVDCSATASATPTMQSTANPNPYAAKTTVSADFPIKVRFALHEIWVYAVAPFQFTHWSVTSGCASPVLYYVGGIGFSAVTWTYEPVSDPDKVLPYSKTYTATGGPSGAATFSVVGAAPGLTFQTPEVTVVRYIAAFKGDDLTNCVKGLHGIILGTRPLLAPSKSLLLATSLCGGLASSANPPPPSPIDVHSFEPTKEYRMLLDIAPVTVSCNSDATIRSVSPEQPQVIANAGYTPLKVAQAALVFSPGERLLRPLNSGSASDFNRVNVRRLDNDHTLLISYLLGSRIATAERMAQYASTGYDPPFIWTVLQLRASCDGGDRGQPDTGVSVALSEFPSTTLYIDGQSAVSSGQINLIPFILDGGTRFNPAGIGNLALAPTCTRHWAGPGKLSGYSGDCLSDVTNGLTGGQSGYDL